MFSLPVDIPGHVNQLNVLFGVFGCVFMDCYALAGLLGYKGCGREQCETVEGWKKELASYKNS